MWSWEIWNLSDTSSFLVFFSVSPVNVWISAISLTFVGSSTDIRLLSKRLRRLPSVQYENSTESRKAAIYPVMNISERPLCRTWQPSAVCSMLYLNSCLGQYSCHCSTILISDMHEVFCVLVNCIIDICTILNYPRFKYLHSLNIWTFRDCMEYQNI